MADQLTSVRFDSETLATLRLLAELHEDSVAAEVRSAVEMHIARVKSEEGFEKRVETKRAELLKKHEELAERLLSSRPKR